MTREEELKAIDDAINAGWFHKITLEEAEEYTINSMRKESRTASLRIQRINSRGLNSGSQKRAAKVNDGIKL